MDTSISPDPDFNSALQEAKEIMQKQATDFNSKYGSPGVTDIDVVNIIDTVVDRSNLKLLINTRMLMMVATAVAVTVLQDIYEGKSFKDDKAIKRYALTAETIWEIIKRWFKP